MWKTLNAYYLKYNPIIVFAIRPALRLVDAHNHPIRAGVAACIATGIAHYAILLPLVWLKRGHIASILTLPVTVHILIGITMASNLCIGLNRYATREFGNRDSGRTKKQA